MCACKRKSSSTATTQCSIALIVTSSPSNMWVRDFCHHHISLIYQKDARMTTLSSFITLVWHSRERHAHVTSQLLSWAGRTHSTFFFQQFQLTEAPPDDDDNDDVVATEEAAVDVVGVVELSLELFSLLRFSRSLLSRNCVISSDSRGL